MQVLHSAGGGCPPAAENFPQAPLQVTGDLSPASGKSRRSHPSPWVETTAGPTGDGAGGAGTERRAGQTVRARSPIRDGKAASRSRQPGAHWARRPAGSRRGGGWAAPVIPAIGAHPELPPGGTPPAGRDSERTRHLRGTPVAVLIGDGLDAAAPRYSDVAVEKAEINANHRHPAAAAAWSGCRC